MFDEVFVVPLISSSIYDSNDTIDIHRISSNTSYTLANNVLRFYNLPYRYWIEGNQRNMSPMYNLYTNSDITFILDSIYE